MTLWYRAPEILLDQEKYSPEVDIWSAGHVIITMIQENYSRLLHKKEWKLKRIQIINRDNNTCTCCHKSKNRMIVHHRYYYAYPNGEKFMPWEYPDSALTTLCYSCHEQIHRTTRIVVWYKPYK